MATLKSTISAFLSGDADLQELKVALGKVLQSKPGREEDLRLLFREAHHKGRISTDDHRAIEEFLRAESAPAEPQTDSKPDKTTVYPPDTKTQTWSARSARRTSPQYKVMPDPDTPPHTGPVEPGVILKARFVLEERIGVGSMGEVYKARDRRREEAGDSDPYIAIKVLTERFKRIAGSPVALQRETRKAQRLAHPNIATVYDFDRDGDIVFMTMQLLEGQSLQELLKQHHPNLLPHELALSITKDICSGLAYAHERSTIHADLKPANIFVNRQQNAKLLDFGIARAVRRAGEGDQTAFSDGGFSALTPAYASCEMFEGQDPDPRDDIYALACVVYELLHGQHPFKLRNSVTARDEKLQPAIPAGLTKQQWRALRRGLEFSRDKRTPSVTEFIDELIPQRKPPYRWIALGSTVVATAAVWAALQQEPADPCANAPELDAATSAWIQQLLGTARAHLEGAVEIPFLVSSAGDAFNAVLEKDACNEEALQGMLQVAELYYGHARDSVADNDIESAQQLVEAGLVADENHAGLLKLLEQLPGTGEDNQQ